MLLRELVGDGVVDDHASEGDGGGYRRQLCNADYRGHEAYGCSSHGKHLGGGKLFHFDVEVACLVLRLCLENRGLQFGDEGGGGRMGKSGGSCGRGYV